MSWSDFKPRQLEDEFDIFEPGIESEARIDPPIHTEYLRSGGATTLIFIVDGANAVISFVKRSLMFLNIVVPPERTIFAYKSLRISTSHFMMVLNIVSKASLKLKFSSVPSEGPIF